jgi:hypothetical protein
LAGGAEGRAASLAKTKIHQSHQYETTGLTFEFVRKIRRGDWIPRLNPLYIAPAVAAHFEFEIS